MVNSALSTWGHSRAACEGRHMWRALVVGGEILATYSRADSLGKIFGDCLTPGLQPTRLLLCLPGHSDTVRNDCVSVACSATHPFGRLCGLPLTGLASGDWEAAGLVPMCASSVWANVSRKSDGGYLQGTDVSCSLQIMYYYWTESDELMSEKKKKGLNEMMDLWLLLEPVCSGGRREGGRKGGEPLTPLPTNLP